MINSKKTWRKSEETILYERVNEYLQRGEDIEIAFESVSKEIGRTTRGCKDRWNLLYKKKRKVLIQPVQFKDHDYSGLFKSFTESYANLERTVADLIEENERLKEKVGRLEEVEKRYNEARNLFKTAI